MFYLGSILGWENCFVAVVVVFLGSISAGNVVVVVDKLLSSLFTTLLLLEFVCICACSRRMALYITMFRRVSGVFGVGQCYIGVLWCH